MSFTYDVIEVSLRSPQWDFSGCGMRPFLSAGFWIGYKILQDTRFKVGKHHSGCAIGPKVTAICRKWLHSSPLGTPWVVLQVTWSPKFFIAKRERLILLPVKFQLHIICKITTFQRLWRRRYTPTPTHPPINP